MVYEKLICKVKQTTLFFSYLRFLCSHNCITFKLNIILCASVNNFIVVAINHTRLNKKYNWFVNL